MKALGIVLKTIEVCNLNCGYFFNGIDDSFKHHPPSIRKDTITHITKFLKEGIEDLKLDHLTIGLHGGEPLLQKREEFDWMCAYFTEQLSPYVALEFSLQTNGLPLNKPWLDLFDKYQIGMGVSIDGPKEYHDKYRVDHRGRGSYDRVVEKIRFYQVESQKRNLPPLGALSVINPEISGRECYRLFVDEIGINSFNFLLPDSNYDNPPVHDVPHYGRFMCEVLDEWTQDDNPKINVTFAASALGLFFGGQSLSYGIGPSANDNLPLITIASNGDLSPVDELRSTDPTMMHTANVVNTSLKAFLDFPIFQEIVTAQQYLPEVCQACCWEKLCGGGGIVNRFSQANRFDNPSIYCEGLKDFYTALMAYMLKCNVSVEQLYRFLL